MTTLVSIKNVVKTYTRGKQKDERVLPEMGARVSFLSTPEAAPAGGATPAAVRAVIIPTDAVQSNGDTGAVYVINGNVVERRVVRLGSRSSDGQLVLSGISSGTHVVVGNLDALTDGAKVHVDPQAASKQGEGS